MNWVLKLFSSALRAIAFCPQDLADRTERGLNFPKWIVYFAELSLNFYFRDLGSNYLFRFLAVPIPFFPCSAILGSEVYSPHLHTR